MVSPEMFRHYPFFTAADDATLKELAMSTELKRFAPGELLFRDDEPAEFLFILRQGEVEIRYPFHGQEYRTVDMRVSGDLLVWSAMIHPYRTTGTGVATRETEAVAVNASKLRELCEKNRELGYDLLKEIAHVMSDRLKGARVQLAAV